ncbi:MULTISPECIES: signal peptidase I [unclassified Salinibacterium]|uniref:signal peptidase I n=1 Tax=unclassified Salinibacterium TaxID=2632331 RepID=UPI00143CE17A|nr:MULTISPECIES: signal peptidase I [unclassified Salinibacterium]
MLRWTVAGVAATLLAAPALLHLGAGVSLMMIDGGSMEPTYRYGDVVVIGAPTGDDLEVGNIVFVGEPPTVYAHRVVEAGQGEARLKGDANAAPDPGWIMEDDVYGIPLAHVGGAAAQWLTAATSVPARLVLGAVIVAALFAPRRQPATTSSSPVAEGARRTPAATPSPRAMQRR